MSIFCQSEGGACWPNAVPLAQSNFQLLRPAFGGVSREQTHTHAKTSRDTNRTTSIAASTCATGTNKEVSPVPSGIKKRSRAPRAGGKADRRGVFGSGLREGAAPRCVCNVPFSSQLDLRRLGRSGGRARAACKSLPRCSPKVCRSHVRLRYQSIGSVCSRTVLAIVLRVAQHYWITTNFTAPCTVTWSDAAIPASRLPFWLRFLQQHARALRRRTWLASPRDTLRMACF